MGHRGLLLVVANVLIGFLGNRFVRFAEDSVGRLLRPAGISIREAFLVAVLGVVNQLRLGQLEPLRLALAGLGQRPFGGIVDRVVRGGTADLGRFGSGRVGLFFGDRVALFLGPHLAHDGRRSPQMPVGVPSSLWGCGPGCSGGASFSSARRFDPAQARKAMKPMTKAMRAKIGDQATAIKARRTIRTIGMKYMVGGYPCRAGTKLGLVVFASAAGVLAGCKRKRPKE